MAKIIAVCRSDNKGTIKEPVPEGVLKEDFGMVGDAHAECGINRQVSLLAEESIEKMRRRGYNLKPGDFAENLTTRGIDLLALPVGTRLEVGAKIILEISQIGKECHTGCAISKMVGKCIMPKEGVFARVIRGGVVRPDDDIRVLDKE